MKFYAVMTKNGEVMSPLFFRKEKADQHPLLNHKQTRVVQLEVMHVFEPYDEHDLTDAVSVEVG